MMKPSWLVKLVLLRHQLLEFTQEVLKNAKVSMLLTKNFYREAESYESHYPTNRGATRILLREGLKIKKICDVILKT